MSEKIPHGTTARVLLALARAAHAKGTVMPTQEQIALMAKRRASGGPVSAGMPYMVGERGPELFVPGQSGGIRPNGSGANFAAGAIVINYPVMQDTRAMDELGRMIDAAISQRLGSLG